MRAGCVNLIRPLSDRDELMPLRQSDRHTAKKRLAGFGFDAYLPRRETVELAATLKLKRWKRSLFRRLQSLAKPARPRQHSAKPLLLPTSSPPVSVIFATSPTRFVRRGAVDGGLVLLTIVRGRSRLAIAVFRAADPHHTSRILCGSPVEPTSVGLSLTSRCSSRFFIYWSLCAEW